MHTQTLSGRVTNVGARHLVPALLAILTGLMLVLMVGFAPMPEVHNATHDTRHTAGFPCH